MENWNELCFTLSENITPNLSEQLFELNVIQALNVLGWKKFNGDLEIRTAFKFGSTTRLIPDIIVKSNNENIFVIEVKKPDSILNSENKSQLKSYMRQLKLDLGILIGDKIQIFYDGSLLENKDFLLIEEIEFNRNDSKGYNFVNLFKKENFDQSNLESYILKKLKKLKEEKLIKRLKKDLLTEKYNIKIFNYLKSEFNDEFNEDIINSVFNLLEIEIKEKKIYSSINSVEKPKVKLNIKDTNSKPIGKYVNETLNNVISRNLITPQECLNLQRKDYSKKIFDIQFPFLAKENSQFYLRERYWKKPVIINGEKFFVCSQWYEVSQNNDRPFYEAWLKNITSEK